MEEIHGDGGRVCADPAAGPAPWTLLDAGHGGREVGAAVGSRGHARLGEILCVSAQTAVDVPACGSHGECTGHARLRAQGR